MTLISSKEWTNEERLELVWEIARVITTKHSLLQTRTCLNAILMVSKMPASFLNVHLNLFEECLNL